MKVPRKKGHQHEDEAPQKSSKVQPGHVNRHDRLVPHTAHVRKQSGGRH